MQLVSLAPVPSGYRPEQRQVRRTASEATTAPVAAKLPRPPTNDAGSHSPTGRSAGCRITACNLLKPTEDYSVMGTRGEQNRDTQALGDGQVMYESCTEPARSGSYSLGITCPDMARLPK